MIRLLVSCVKSTYRARFDVEKVRMHRLHVTNALLLGLPCSGVDGDDVGYPRPTGVQEGLLAVVVDEIGVEDDS